MAQDHSDVLIKRYGAGRLYNTATLSYVVPADLAEMLVRGQRLTVRDAASGADITREVLDRLN